MYVSLALAVGVMAQVPTPPYVYVADTSGVIWQVDPLTLTAVNVGPTGIDWDGGLAFDQAGQLYGIGNSVLWRIQLAGRTITPVAPVSFRPPIPWPRGTPRGLAISDSGLGFVATIEMIGVGGLYTLELKSGRTVRQGLISRPPRGDLAFDQHGQLLMAGCMVTGFFPVDCGGFTDTLFALNLDTGGAAEIGSLGIAGVQALATAGQELFGISDQGDFIRINPATGTSVRLGKSNPVVLAASAASLAAAVPRLQPGDATRDGEFNAADLVRAFQAGGYERAEITADWQAGDWNCGARGSLLAPPVCDGRFTAADIVAAWQTGLYETGPYIARQAQGVPEPNNWLWVAAGLILGLLTRRYR
ncbi:MAG: hypothetical protein HY372_01370 [Candidatus Andersenbacteria bacterium]|nr:hypothetical protein [Candidatus Andersenbacteria bacterium]